MESQKRQNVCVPLGVLPCGSGRRATDQKVVSLNPMVGKLILLQGLADCLLSFLPVFLIWTILENTLTITIYFIGTPARQNIHMCLPENYEKCFSLKVEKPCKR